MDTQHKDIQHKDIQHEDIQHKNIQHSNKNATLSINVAHDINITRQVSFMLNVAY